jgi:hypothetical protein
MSWGRRQGPAAVPGSRSPTRHTQIPAVLLLVVSNDGQTGVNAHTLCWGHRAAFPMNSAIVGAGGTGIEPAPCGCGESGSAFFPVSSRLASCARPEFKPFLVSSRLSASECPAVKSAVNDAGLERLCSGSRIALGTIHMCNSFDRRPACTARPALQIASASARDA